MPVTKIAVIGQQCSGKTSAAKLFKKYFDASYVVKIADPIYDTLAALRQDKHRSFMQQFADLAKEHFGENVLVDVFIENVKFIEKQKQQEDMMSGKERNALIVCDDIRFPYELGTVRELGFNLVAVKADTEVRKQRAEAQGFDFIENHNSELLVPQLIPKADFIIPELPLYSIDQLDEHCQDILRQVLGNQQPVS